MTKEQSRGILETPFSVPKNSINTLAPERCVKQVTKAAASVVGQDRRDVYVYVYVYVEIRCHRLIPRRTSWLFSLLETFEFV